MDIEHALVMINVYKMVIFKNWESTIESRDSVMQMWAIYPSTQKKIERKTMKVLLVTLCYCRPVATIH